MKRLSKRGEEGAGDIFRTTTSRIWMESACISGGDDAQCLVVRSYYEVHIVARTRRSECLIWRMGCVKLGAR